MRGPQSFFAACGAAKLMRPGTLAAALRACDLCVKGIVVTVRSGCPNRSLRASPGCPSASRRVVPGVSRTARPVARTVSASAARVRRTLLPKCFAPYVAEFAFSSRSIFFFQNCVSFFKLLLLTKSLHSRNDKNILQVLTSEF
jgi:hypothetical protein